VNDNGIESAIARVPPGSWGVGVSGGGDSVALLLALHDRADLRLHVIHLDHQTRGAMSAADAAFVRELGARLNIPCTIAQRDEIEPGMNDLPANPSAKYRAIRHELFAQVTAREKLQGMILAHQRDDQAETVLLRLLRGGGAAAGGLVGMRARTTLGGVEYLRPLLKVSRESLREFLRARDEKWREDASNQSTAYARNRLRVWLDSRKEFARELVELADACAELADWARGCAPVLPGEFAATKLAELPRILGRESARRWLIERGAPAELLGAAALDHLRSMAADAATPARQQFPRGLFVHRNSGWLRGE
jgi:tRNA(Ile)-lysidine synthase